MLKKFLLKRIFNVEERAIIWNAVAYSDLVYRRRGKVDKVVKTTNVLNKMKPIIGVEEQKFSYEQMTQAVEKAMKEGFELGLQRAQHQEKPIIVIPMISEDEKTDCLDEGEFISEEKCSNCEHKEECENSFDKLENFNELKYQADINSVEKEFEEKSE